MTVKKNVYRGTDALIDYWKLIRYSSPCFSVWERDPSGLVVYYNGDDMAEAEAVLKNWAASLDQDAENQFYTFKTHSESTKPESFSKKFIISCVFSPSENYIPMPQNPASVGKSGSTGESYLLGKLETELNIVKSELSALKDQKIEQDDEDDEDDAPETDALSGINTLLGNPLIQQVIGLVVDRFAKTPEKRIITNLAGVPDDNDKAAALGYVEILMAKGVTVDHLRKLAEMPGIKIKTLLSML